MLDAYYLRCIAKFCGQHNIPIITIHDAFLISYDCGYWLLSTANYCFLNYQLNVPLFYNNSIATLSSSTILV